MARPRAPFDINRQRRTEIARVVMHRHGRLAETDDGIIYLQAAALHLNPRDGDLHFALEQWCRRVGATLPPEQINRIVEDNKPRKLSATRIAKMLKVFDAERTALGLTSIGACDVSKAERLRRRKKRHRAAQQARRRARGVMPRDQYLAQSLSRTRPWEALGISRRTWERRGRPTLTQVRAQHSSYSCAQTCDTTKNRRGEKCGQGTP
jgi:hypothetical protein